MLAFHGRLILLLTLNFLLVEAVFSQTVTPTPGDLSKSTLSWLAKWRTFRLDFTTEASITNAKGGKRHFFQKGTMASGGGIWRLREETVGEVDGQPDVVTRGIREVISTNKGTLSLQFDYPFLTGQRLDGIDDNPFRLFEMKPVGKHDPPRRIVLFNETKTGAPIFLPLIMESDESGSNPIPIARQLLTDASAKWGTPNEGSDVPGLAKVSLQGEGNEWELTLTQSGVICRAEQISTGAFRNKSGKTLGELGIQRIHKTWELVDPNENWSQFDVLADVAINFQNGTSHIENSRSKYREIRFAVTSNDLQLSKALENGAAVDLVGSPQIKAEWQDGKVVRVYNREAVETLADLRFIPQPTSILSRAWMPAVAFGAVVLIVGLLYRRRYNRRAI